MERQEQLYYEEEYDEEIIYVDNDEWYTTQEKTYSSLRQVLEK